MKRYSNMMMVLVLASACATDPGDDGNGGTDGTEADTEANNDADTEADTEAEGDGTGDGTGGADDGPDVDPMDGYGTIRIEPVPADDDVAIFNGTTEVVATVHYESCLQTLYLGNPELMPSGAEGAPIFEAWHDELCTLADMPACTVANIEQTLLPDNDVYTLKVTYAISDPASLAGSEIHVGPLPISDFAGCDARVELQQSGLIGRDANGVNIWRIATLPASNVAVTNQSAPLRVEISPN